MGYVDCVICYMDCVVDIGVVFDVQCVRVSVQVNVIVCVIVVDEDVFGNVECVCVVFDQNICGFQCICVSVIVCGDGYVFG